jgi:hypothetical protein
MRSWQSGRWSRIGNVGLTLFRLCAVAAGLGAVWTAIVLQASDGYTQSLPKPYVRFPFEISSPNNGLDARFRIVEERTYYFDLEFDYSNQAEKVSLSKLVGSGARYPDGRYGVPGVTVSIRLLLRESGRTATDAPLLDALVDTQGIVATVSSMTPGAGYFRRLITSRRLSAGEYDLHASAPEPSKEFSGMPIALSITFDSRVAPANR